MNNEIKRYSDFIKSLEKTFLWFDLEGFLLNDQNIKEHKNVTIKSDEKKHTIELLVMCETGFEEAVEAIRRFCDGCNLSAEEYEDPIEILTNDGQKIKSITRHYLNIPLKIVWNME